MKTILAAFVTILAVTGGTSCALAQASLLNGTMTLKGYCLPSSNTSEGPVDADLSKYRTRISCDTVLISPVPDKPDRLLVQFANTAADNGRVIGFAGVIVDAGHMRVDAVYLRPSQRSVPKGGECQFFLSRMMLTGVVCGARIETGGRAYGAIMSLDTDR